jgi:hypothetical protein
MLGLSQFHGWVRQDLDREELAAGRRRRRTTPKRKQSFDIMCRDVLGIIH